MLTCYINRFIATLSTQVHIKHIDDYQVKPNSLSFNLCTVTASDSVSSES